VGNKNASKGSINTYIGYKIAAITVGISFLLLSIVSWYGIKSHQDLQIQTVFKKHAVLLKSHLEQTLDTNIQLLVRLASRWGLRGGIPFSEWKLDTKYLTKHNSNFQAIEWVDSKFHVRWITPLKENRQALNLNLALEKNRKTALISSRDQNKIMVTRVVQLVQGGNGFLVYVPIKVKNKFDGFILGVFRTKDILNTILGDKAFKGYKLTLSDGGKQFYSTANKNYRTYDKWHQSVDIKLRNITWSLQLWPDPATLGKLHSDLPISILFIGVVISLLLSVLIYSIGMLRIRGAVLLEKSNAIELIFKGTAAVSGAKDFNEAIKNCVDLICRMIGWKAGHAYILDEIHLDKLIPTNIWYLGNSSCLKDFCEVTRVTNFNPGQGLPGRVWCSRAPVWIENVHEDDNFPRAKTCKNLPLKGAVGFPIIVHNKVVTVLEFFHSKSMRKDKRLLELFTVLGEHLGQIWEKKHIERALRESEEMARLILESAGEGIYGLDNQGNTTFVNPAVEKMLGYTADELIGHGMHALIHHSYPTGEPYPKEECPIFATITDGKIHTIANEVLWRKNGSCFPIEYTSTPIRKDNKLVGTVVTFNDITEKVKTEKALARLARHDCLTDLPNRYLYNEVLKKTIDRAIRKNESFALLTLDLDGFKVVNDTMGHDVGDLVLKEVAARLSGVLRAYDFVARLGGDEFAIIFQDLSSQHDAHAIATEIINAINVPFHYSGEKISIGISVGISFYPKDTDNIKSLIKYTDIALYNAKNSGRNQYRLYNNLDLPKSRRSIE